MWLCEKYSLCETSASLVLCGKFPTFAFYQPGYRFTTCRMEESLDSIEQCTGEEPGLDLGREQKVPQKITTCTYFERNKRYERVKMWGKSPRHGSATNREGKPYMLKCHVYHLKELLVRCVPSGIEGGGWAD